MNEEDLAQERSRSLESLRHLRLMALLHDLVDDEGRVEAAELLGVSYRTLVRAVQSGKLTGRMSDALERILLSGGGSAAARQKEEMGALKQEVEALTQSVETLEKEMRNTLAALEGGGEALREEHALGMRRLERRLAQVEAGQGTRGGPEAAPMEKEPDVKPAWRPYRDLVTLEPEPGEEQVYGEATPLIVEWRRVCAERARAGDRLSKAVVEERMRELEIAMIGEHELTLPPATYPWDRFDRRDEVRRRTQALNRVRVERARAQLRRWLRRVLTLGLWRR